MAVRLLISAFLFSFTLCITSILFSQNCNCLPGWNYRIPITIDNNYPFAYSNFEVRDSLNTLGLIVAGKMKPDGSDIRFTDSQCNLLSYYIESGINTNATIIWIKAASLPANGNTIIYMYYGNPSASAGSNAVNTFTFFEGFDNNNLGRFGPGPFCSSGTPSVSFTNGLATFNWTTSAIWISDSAISSVCTVEANVISAAGNFPGLYWARSTVPNQSMALLMGLGMVRISKAPLSGTGYCVSHNFTVPSFPAVNPAGTWAFTWIATGSQKAAFPGAGTWTTSDNELPRNVPLKICLGGVETGTGTYTIDWVRARKYAQNVPGVTNGAENSVPKSPGNSLTATALGSSTIRLNWADSSNNETKFILERSLNGGANWSFRDSVNANTTQYFDNGLTQNTQYCYRVYAVNCVGNSVYSNMACSTTSYIGIIKTSTEIPKEYRLYQNYPNPFNPVTIIKFDLSSQPMNKGLQTLVQIKVFDILGMEVTTLVNEQLLPGTYEVDFDGRNLASGLYIYKLIAGNREFNKKMVIIK